MDSIALISRPTLRRTRRRCTDGNASSSGTRRKENYISQKETGKRGRRNGANDEAVEEGRRGLGRWLGLARPVSGLVKRARCSLVAGEGIVRRRIGALRLEGEKVAVCVCKERRSEAGREERNKETARERRKRQGLLGVCARNSAAVSITLHPVTRFPTELFPPIRHARRAERTSGLLARRYDCGETMEGRARVDSSFSGLLSSGMRHFNPEECTSRRNTDAFPKLAVLSP